MKPSLKVNFADVSIDEKSVLEESKPAKKSTMVVHEALILEPGEKIDKLEKVYWSRKFDKILARLNISKRDRPSVVNLGQRGG